MVFWAKTDKEGNPGVSVFDHLLNVGYVARCLATYQLRFLQQFDLDIETIGALAALHDIGKICPGFQRKSESWLAQNGLVATDRNSNWKDEMESDHALVSHAFLQQFLCDQGVSRRIAKYVALALGAHHGKMKALPNDRRIETRRIVEENSGIQWDVSRQDCAREIAAHFGTRFSLDAYHENSPVLWWLAGLTSVADWIGSNEQFFSPIDASSNPDASAKLALEGIGLSPFSVRENLGFHDLFWDQNQPHQRWEPNDMQKAAYTLIDGPGVYVIEAPMGLGKTEAALWVAYKLLSTGDARGIYFALPTQATSNRMHLRFQSFLGRIVLETQTSRLIHGNSWLLDEKPVLDLAQTEATLSEETDARVGHDWFSSAKRSLIAPFGVGTIDQALLGVVAANHFFVRHFALAGKIVILDEVHSYDIYTQTLIDKLVTTLEGLGCTVIILSATLGERQLKTLVGDSVVSNDAQVLPYPYISGRCQEKSIVPRPIEMSVKKSVGVVFVDSADAQKQAVELAKQGGVVLWICNTVDAAQAQYRAFRACEDVDFKIGLLHSRFPYWRRESLESEWMTRLGKEGETRCGTILISTQICEQSVDLDADLLITELAPTDMLLQRIGRLWRHNRDFRPIKAPFVYILQESLAFEVLRDRTAAEIVSVLGSKALVYSPYILLRTLQVWLQKQDQCVSLPQDIRVLIRDTYQENKASEPSAWSELFNDWYGSDSAKKMMAQQVSNIFGVSLEDQEGAQTRLNGIETVSVVLCREISGKRITFLDGSQFSVEGKKRVLPIAQAIHKNMVQVAEHHFEGKFCNSFPAFEPYLYDNYTVGVIASDGSVCIPGLSRSAYYNDDEGLVVRKVK